MKNTKWNIKSNSKNKNIQFNDFPLDTDVLQILYSRGIKTKNEIRNFLNPKLENIRNPYDLKDMEKSVNIIKKAIKDNKNIWIYGDYDVDGITSTSILYLSLLELGATKVNYYIPIRDEGYGLNNEALEKIKNSGADLLITVDCGITAFAEVEYANSINLPIIITDHHNLQGNKVPNALTVINPKRKENIYPFEFLAGVGTIFMVILALFETFQIKEKAYKYLDLVSIGTIADIVPLTEENRIFTKFGLEQLPYSKNKGLNYLLYKLFNDNNEKTPKSEYTTYDVGFIIAPIFNAAGRLKDAKMVVKLLISDNNREIEAIVKELINKNFERKELQNNVIEKVEENIEKNNLNNDFIIVDYSPEYHHGVIGIAASRIVDLYYKPVIIMEVKKDEGIAIGSCRSIENFNILEALQSMPELFVKFGGHAGAAGFTIPIKNIELFKNKVNKFAENKLNDDDFIKIINIDKQIPIQKISYEFCQSINLLKPFGFGNPNPTFQTKGVILENIKYIGENKNHIMFDFKQKGFHNRNAVWFNAGTYFEELNNNVFYDIVFKLKIEEFQDKFYTKIYIDDMKPSELKNDTLSFYHSLYSTAFPLKSIFYTNLNVDLEPDIILDSKIEFDQISLFNGRQFLGKLDYNISNLLILLKKYYNWDFVIKIENITKNTSHNIVDVLIKRNYNFECFDYTDTGIFKKIKEFLIGQLEYNSTTKKILSSHFKDKKNLLLFNVENNIHNNIVNNIENNLTNVFLTTGIYYSKINNKKSLMVTKNPHNFKYNNSFIKKYYDISDEYTSNLEYDFIVFFVDEFDDSLMKMLDFFEENKKNLKFFIVLNKSISNSKEFSKSISYMRTSNNLSGVINTVNKPGNVRFLNSLKKEERKNLKNIFLEYLPTSEKIKLKKSLEQKEFIYCDHSIEQIL